MVERLDARIDSKMRIRSHLALIVFRAGRSHTPRPINPAKWLAACGTESLRRRKMRHPDSMVKAACELWQIARLEKHMATSFYGYHYYTSTGKKHSGITNDPDRRQAEHRNRWPSGWLEIVTGPLTEAQARAWEKQQTKTVTPER